MLGISSNYYDLYVFDLLWKEDLIDRSVKAVVLSWSKILPVDSVNFDQQK